MFTRLVRRLLLLVMGAVWLVAAAGVEKLSVVGLFKDKAIVELDGKRRLLRAGETSPEGVKLVSADSKAAVLEIDGVQKTYELGSHIGSSFAEPKHPAVRIWPTPNRMYTVVGSINGYPVDFVVDTGATLVSMSGREAKRLGIDYRVIGEPSLSSTASGVDKIYVVSLDKVKVGDIELRNIRGAVHDGDFPPMVLLGMSFLGRLDMQQDGPVLELRRKF
jgi:aspartyl protease family protein